MHEKKREVQKRDRNCKNSQTEILELKNTVNEIKNTIKIFKIRLNQAEQRICKLQNKSLHIIYLQEKKEKGIEKSEESLCELQDEAKQHLNYGSLRSRRKKRTEDSFKRIMTENVPNLERDMAIQGYEAQRFLNRSSQRDLQGGIL